MNRKLADYTSGVKLVFPSGQGGHNWNPMAFDASRGLVYIPAIEIGEYLFGGLPRPTTCCDLANHTRSIPKLGRECRRVHDDAGTLRLHAGGGRSPYLA